MTRTGSVRSRRWGLDETLFCRRGQWRTQQWCTSIVNLDADGAQLLDVVTGRSATGPSGWLEARPETWRDRIRYGVSDLSGPYRKVYDETLPHVIQVADPFHLIRVRHEALCVRGWVRGPPCRSVAADR